MPEVDVLVIGGGPAGLSAGIVFAQQGLSVWVCEQKQFPVEKACGEGVMPNGVENLARLGVLQHLPAGAAFPFRGIRYLSRHGRSVEGLFQGTSGLGIRRNVLSNAFYAAASRHPNLHIHTGQKAILLERLGVHTLVRVGDSLLKARLVVGADGLTSGVRNWANLKGSPGVFKRWGASLHFLMPPWTDLVEVYWSEGIEAYVTPVSPGAVNLAFLWDRTRIPKVPGGERLIPALLRHFPTLAEKLTGGVIDGPVRAVGPLQRVVKTPIADGVVLIGDAAGYLDALTGEGISLATAQAAALEETVAPLLLKREGPMQMLTTRRLFAYQAEVRKIVRPYYQTTRLALWLSLHPKLVETVISIFARRPALFEQFLLVNMGRASLWSIAAQSLRSILPLITLGMSPAQEKKPPL